MAERDVTDFFALDRDVSRAVARLERWREAVSIDPEADAGDPFDGVRWVSSKSTRDALVQHAPSEVDRPLRDALVRWTAALVVARVGLDGERAVAKEKASPHGRFDGDPPHLVSWREAWRGVVAARTGAEALRWLDAAADAARPVADAIHEHAARRTEVARRLGAAHPWDALVPVPRDAVRSAAASLLDATEDIARSRRGRDADEAIGAAYALHDAVARDAGDGWPARLSASWIERVFDGRTQGMPIRLEHLPAPLGAASFARALYAFGVAVRVAAAPRAMPFALAREPAFVAAHRLGFVLASLVARDDFHRRVLGLGRGTAHEQSRILARSALLDARLHAARVLLDADGSTHAFEEMGVRLFGAALDGRLRGAWPAARDDEPARLVGLLQARAFHDALRDRFDSDWYRNPRAWSHLRDAGPAYEAVDEPALAAEAKALGRSFEEALG